MLLLAFIMGAVQNQGTVVDLQLQHPYLRNTKTRTTTTHTELLATIPAQLPTYRKWKEELDSHPPSPYLLLPTAHKFDEGGVCSTSGQLTLHYPYFPRILTSEIALRKKENRRFTEGELWYLLYSLTMLKAALAQAGENVGDIHPRNVFLNETGEIKVASLRSWPGQVSNYRRAILEEDCGYLAPEDIERLKLGAMDNQVNTESEIFAMGLVLLSVASLQLQQDLYEMKDNEFQEDLFFSRLGKFQHDTTYSEILRAVVSNLLEVEPLKRMNLQELKALLEKHSENIIAKKPLRIDNVAKKLQKTITEMFKLIKPVESPAKPSVVRQSGEKIMNFINFEDKRPSSQTTIPQVRTETSIEVDPKPQRPPLPIVVNNYAAEEPHRPAISKIYAASISPGPIIKKTESVPFEKLESPPKYKPFETLSRPESNQPSPSKSEDSKPQSNGNLREEGKSVMEGKLIEESKVQEVVVEKPANTEIWLGEQTSIRQLNMFMETKREGFDINSLINTKYEPEAVEAPANDLLPSLQSYEQQQPQQQESVVKEVEEEEEVSEEKPANISHIKNDQSPINNSLLKSSEVSHHSSPQEKSLLKNSVENLESNLLQFHEAEKQAEQVKVEIEKQIIDNDDSLLLREQKPQEAQIMQQPSKEDFEEPKKQAKLQAVEISTPTNSLSPTVKLWGMKPAIAVTTAPLNTNSTNIREIEPTPEKIEPAETEQKPLQAGEASKEENNYILIEQESKHAIQRSQVQPSIEQSEVVHYHTYADIATEGSFEECWQVILSFLKDPTEFTALLHEDKVKIRILEDRWSLKVGPGIFDILLNKEEGKFLLRNCEQSGCEGEMLGGVFKDEDKRHRLWFNSAYYYQGKQVPSREVIEACLQACKERVGQLL